VNSFWQTIQSQAYQASQDEPALASFYYAHVINHKSLCSSLSFTLAESLGNAIVPASLLRDVIQNALEDDDTIIERVVKDLKAVFDRDPACNTYLMPLLFFKGFQALQCYRIAHYLWQSGRESLAFYFQSLMSESLHVDIHPAAVIGCGVMIDHATGIVIGETAVVGDDVSILHSVTLGGSGCSEGKRHPTIASGVLIAAGSKVLGNVNVGEGAKIAAGSVVTVDVEAHTTVAGVPAKVVNRGLKGAPALDMQQGLDTP